MVEKLLSAAFSGIEAICIEIEVDVSDTGYEAPLMVGLPDAGVRESIQRVRSALENSGFSFPRNRTVVNLAPAVIRKEGPAFDLPIALGLLLADGAIRSESVTRYLVVGELALDGRVRSVPGVLSVAMLARDEKDRDARVRAVIVPRANAREAAVVDGIDVIPVDSLTQAAGFLAGELPLEPMQIDIDDALETASRYDVDFGEVRGQEHVKRALTIAAAGGHNALMIGPPGTGKTMLAKRMPTIMPALSRLESLETTRIHSVSGELSSGTALLATRPVRTPHHSASTSSLVGGGSVPQAGEVSLAHHGVLFLDELPEFSRTALESMRQPLEDGCVTIARAHSTVSFPASFMLIAAMNPCPCGYLTDSRRTCQCHSLQVERYVSRISGPLIDRIDIHVDVPAVPLRELRDMREGTSSAAMRDQVTVARGVQRARYGVDSLLTNAKISGRVLRACCELNGSCELVLQQAMSELGLSARAHDKVLRVARTIADLAERNRIIPEDLMEAIHFRRLDRKT